MSRPLRDRLGEAIRISRIGASTKPFWSDLPDETQEDWRRSADRLIVLGSAGNLQYAIIDTRERSAW